LIYIIVGAGKNFDMIGLGPTARRRAHEQFVRRPHIRGVLAMPFTNAANLREVSDHMMRKIAFMLVLGSAQRRLTGLSNAPPCSSHSSEFDVIALDGDDLRKLPLSMRKTNLAVACVP
jgi:hypothetical protein